MTGSRINSQRFAAIPAFALVIVLALAMMTLVPAPRQAHAAVTIDRNHVKQVIYPTFGYPQISRCADRFTIEFDPRDQDWSQPLPAMVDFTVYVNTSVSDYPINRQLRVDSFRTGYSTRWPEYAQAVQANALIYLVDVTIPETVPCDLYDLTVNGQRPDG